MAFVLDASVVVAALLEPDARGRWARQLLATDDPAAPHLMPVEVANVLRQRVDRSELSANEAATTHDQLADLGIELFPYAPFAGRVWELRANVTPYDAWYVSLAEALDAPLATADGRLVRASGPRCRFEVFPDST